ncbi:MULTISPECIES: cytochrome c oxidase subunit II [Flavobacterium]|uniref:cytochrome-c oxidase n=1 Tax=Flavobacterium sedimenticola TaxID=3043286 RepID=A0ABT6XMB6_9FLAO|nr:cytochrome c oxidase subunit II [Flavobacterium sedimenticola]MDI9255814.1 cytochrome c oxidase subunit II [Flavobacterium sedimenticola]
MTTFLVLTVVVLLAVALWQLTKIFDLTQVGSGNVNDTQIANDNDNKVNGFLMFAFLGFIYLTTILCLLYYSDLPLIGDSASEHGPEVDRLMVISLVLIFIVQTVTQALLHYFAFKYRGRQGQKALYFADNNKLEFIWSIIPAVVLAGLILYGLYAWTNIMFVDEKDEQDAIVIELYAQQFKWEARYAGADNVLGKANVRYIEGVNNLGVDLSDPNAQDDFTAAELHIPKGKRVIFKMRSQDVLHSAYMPHFRAQMNCVPGMVTSFSFVPTLTTAEMREKPAIIQKVANINAIRAKKSEELVAKGQTALDPYTFDYLLLCNKICGASHYNMQMKIVVDSPEDFKNWLKENSPKTIVQAVKTAAAEAKASEESATQQPKDSAAAPAADTTVVAQAEMKQ